MQFLRARAVSITPFKAGPDFLDPMWHQAVTGCRSFNLDTQMMGEAACRQQLAAQLDNGSLAVIEGVMGLFDGRSGVGGKGSTLDLARVLGLPVVLVIDARGMSGSIVPLVAGFQQQAAGSGVAIGGLLANRVGSRGHAALLSGLLADHGLPPLLGWITKKAPTLPERHLGLEMPGGRSVPDFGSALQLDLERFLAVCGELPGCGWAGAVEAAERLSGRCVAVARDAACCFIYPANLIWLEQQGAALQFFSPLKGEAVPADADAVWLPGGYPELHAESLASSATWPSLRRHIEAGRPVLAECGGMMLLGETLIDHRGNGWPMSGVLPFTTRMQPGLAGLGYRDDASGARGHEFHHSTRSHDAAIPAAFNCRRGDRGLHYKNSRSSYIHWWFPAAPDVTASWFGAAA